MIAVLTVLLSSLSIVGASPAAQRSDPAHGFQGENSRKDNLDYRKGGRAPDARQRSLVAQKGAKVRWNAFGTPAAMRAESGFLAAGLSAEPVTAAREWVLQNRELFRLSEQSVANLELVYNAPVGAGSAVLLRQQFGSLPTGPDGLLALGVVDGKIAYVSSSIAGDGNDPGAATITAETAIATAAASAGRSLGLAQVRKGALEGDTQLFAVDGFTQPAYVRLVAVPTPQNGVRSAWEVVLMDSADEPLGVSTYVDAQTNDILLSENLVDYFDEDDPGWSVFPASPPLDYSSTDTRVGWCWLGNSAECDRILVSPASPLAWDVLPATSLPSNTSIGNNARSFEKWFSNNTGTVGTNPATARPGRDYAYPWTNQWYEQRCNPSVFTSPQRNDIDAAIANLFAMHNQMHDWSYRLGFTEQTFNLQDDNFGRGGLANDSERGNAQAGGVVGGPPGFASRDNANQSTGRDGLPPVTNMYLWQPIAGSFYASCVDGDYDMSIIGHEYTHATSNRMVAGPNLGLSGDQAGAMGESWSDLSAMEILNEYSFVPVSNENPYAVGPYATGDKQSGIRNYGMNVSPLNYSNVGYDFVCNLATCARRTQVHADGEIWSATNFAIRQALNARYDGAYPSSSAALQLSCAEGQTPVDQCPGNRRWIQLVYDAWLLMAVGNVSMLDARDAMLAADMIRFGGANQDVLWDVFASRGMGEFAFSNGVNDSDPIPSFESPYANEATVVLTPLDGSGNLIPNARLFVGHYEARVMPVADTDAATALSNQVQIVPGTYDLLVQAPGYGHKRGTLELKAGMVKEFTVGPMLPNLASSAWGASASGDGTNLGDLIDDTEATNWASLNSPAIGKQVTVRLDPSKPFHQIRRVQVSALLRSTEPTNPGGDTGGQNRYTALRQFEIWTCQAQGSVDCSQDSQFTKIYTSAADAFPAVRPRPRAPNMIIRSFDIPQTKATHVRLRVLNNQCTGTPGYAGDQDDDPLNVTDCVEGSVQDDNVRAAELQVFNQ